MRVVITGGAGFIGTNLRNYIRSTEPDTEVILYDLSVPYTALDPKTKFIYGDVRDLASLIRAFEDVDEVYHLAGLLGPAAVSVALQANVIGTCNVMDAVKIAGVKRVYNVAKPHFESFFENPYTMTKHAAELVGLFYRETAGIEVSTVRWYDVIGPQQSLYPVRKLVPTMTLFALHDIPLEIFGTGDQLIDPIDVWDLCRFTVYACRNLGKVNGPVVDLGSGNAISCNDAVAVIQKVVQDMTGIAPSSVKHLPLRQGEKPGVNLVADMKFWNSIGMKTEYSFEDSIRRIVGYILTLSPQYKLNALSYYGKQKLAA